MFVHSLDLLQRVGISLVLIKNVLGRQLWNTFRNKPRQGGLEGLQFARIAKARHGHEAVLLECCFWIQGLGFIQSR